MELSPEDKRTAEIRELLLSLRRSAFRKLDVLDTTDGHIHQPSQVPYDQSRETWELVIALTEEDWVKAASFEQCILVLRQIDGGLE